MKRRQSTSAVRSSGWDGRGPREVVVSIGARLVDAADAWWRSQGRPGGVSVVHLFHPITGACYRVQLEPQSRTAELVETEGETLETLRIAS